MTYDNVKSKRAEFLAAQNQFLILNHIFYLKIIENIRAKMKVPNGNLITYLARTEENSNIAEDWVFIDDNMCFMNIALIFDDVSHVINFSSKKNSNDSFLLFVDVLYDKKEFTFQIHGQEQIQKLNFDNVTEFISLTLLNAYDKDIKEYKMGG